MSRAIEHAWWLADGLANSRLGCPFESYSKAPVVGRFLQIHCAPPTGARSVCANVGQRARSLRIISEPMTIRRGVSGPSSRKGALAAGAMYHVATPVCRKPLGNDGAAQGAGDPRVVLQTYFVDFVFFVRRTLTGSMLGRPFFVFSYIETLTLGTAGDA